MLFVCVVHDLANRFACIRMRFTDIDSNGIGSAPGCAIGSGCTDGGCDPWHGFAAGGLEWPKSRIEQLEHVRAAQLESGICKDR